MTMTRAAIVSLALLFLATTPARAQGVERTIDQYDTEGSIHYVYMTEEGGFDGSGVLVDAGYRVWQYGDWRLQAIAELMLAEVQFEDFDAFYKQLAVGARFGRMFTPRLRAFGQFQIGLQNDGFEDSNTGPVFMPGVGASYAITEQFDAEVKLDFPAVRYSDRTFNQFRLAVGVGMPFGAN